MKTCAVILCGGRSSRMKIDKATLKRGQDTFLCYLEKQLLGLDEHIVSINDASLPIESPYRAVTDIHPGLGPLSGIESALLSCTSPVALCVSVDMPLFSFAIADALIGAWETSMKALVPVTEDGRIQPTCALYSRDCVHQLSSCLDEGMLRMRDVLSVIGASYISSKVLGFNDDVFTNVNTPEELEILYSRYPDLK